MSRRRTPSEEQADRWGQAGDPQSPYAAEEAALAAYVAEHGREPWDDEDEVGAEASPSGPPPTVAAPPGPANDPLWEGKRNVADQQANIFMRYIKGYRKPDGSIIELGDMKREMLAYCANIKPPEVGQMWVDLLNGPQWYQKLKYAIEHLMEKYNVDGTVIKSDGSIGYGMKIRGGGIGNAPVVRYNPEPVQWNILGMVLNAIDAEVNNPVLQFNLEMMYHQMNGTTQAVLDWVVENATHNEFNRWLEAAPAIAGNMNPGEDVPQVQNQLGENVPQTRDAVWRELRELLQNRNLPAWALPNQPEQPNQPPPPPPPGAAGMDGHERGGRDAEPEMTLAQLLAAAELPHRDLGRMIEIRQVLVGLSHDDMIALHNAVEVAFPGRAWDGLMNLFNNPRLNAEFLPHLRGLVLMPPGGAPPPQPQAPAPPPPPAPAPIPLPPPAPGRDVRAQHYGTSPWAGVPFHQGPPWARRGRGMGEPIRYGGARAYF